MGRFFLLDISYFFRSKEIFTELKLQFRLTSYNHLNKKGMIRMLLNLLQIGFALGLCTFLLIRFLKKEEPQPLVDSDDQEHNL